MKRLFQILAFLFLFGFYSCAQMDSYVYISSAKSADDEGGIQIFRQDGRTGKLTRIGTDLTTQMSRYLTVRPDQKRLYSITNETIYAFQISPKTGELALLNQHQLYGAGPCYVSVDPLDRFAFVSNYSGGQVQSFTLSGAGEVTAFADTIMHERTSIDTNRQQAPHPHMAMPSPAGKWLLVPDLGADLTYVYRVDQKTGRLSPTPPDGLSPGGTGPRHLAFHPTKSIVYVLNEIIGSVTSFHFEEGTGKLSPINTVTTLPDTTSVYNKSADIHITPNGKYLYASNRGPNTIATFAIDEQGALEPLGWFSSGGAVPRGFGINPSGKYMIVGNKESNNLTVFEINADGSTKMIDQVTASAPQAVKFFPIKN